MGKLASQNMFVDAIKVLAAQLIVLHHLAWYGPMSDSAAGLSLWIGAGQDWLVEYGRYAVSAFLAIGGYLSAQGFRTGVLPGNRTPLRLILQRYWRLVAPFAIALVFAVICSAIARHWMQHDSIGDPVRLRHFLAHVFMLQGLLHVPSLSAGVWYVAIDFQLYASFVLLLWLGRTLATRAVGAEFLGPALVVVVGFISLVYFNRHPVWDNTALYFFGTYALGVTCRWAVEARRPAFGLLGITLTAFVALDIDYRPRIAVALAVSLAIALGHLYQRQSNGMGWITRLGQTSYALFLVHFPVCLLVNALFTRAFPENPTLNLLGIFVAWLTSNIAALVFHGQIEQRLLPWLQLACSRRQVLVPQTQA